LVDESTTTSTGTATVPSPIPAGVRQVRLVRVGSTATDVAYRPEKVTLTVP
jgi:hypothetical protein